jgi:pyrophosphatase PpaX
MCKNILFDWDGTLANSLDNWVNTCKKVFADYGYDFKRNEIARIFFEDSDGTFGLKLNGKTDEFKAAYLKDVMNWMPTVQLNPGVKGMLMGLKRRERKMAIVTSSSRKAVILALKNLGIEKYFDIVLGLEDVEKMKPDPEIITKAMKLLGATKLETVIVGDSNHDILAGKKFGIRTVLYYSKYNHDFYHLKDREINISDYVIENFGELMTIVN